MSNKTKRDQPAAAAGRLGEPAGDAAGPDRRGQPPRGPGTRRQPLLDTSEGDRPGHDAAVPGADFDDQKAGGLVFSDFLNLFFFNRKEGLGATIKALEQKGLFQSLAEPNLIAYNGQEASFLAGGEFPVPDRAGRRPARSRSCSRNSASG